MSSLVFCDLAGGKHIPFLLFSLVSIFVLILLHIFIKLLVVFRTFLSLFVLPWQDLPRLGEVWILRVAWSLSQRSRIQSPAESGHGEGLLSFLECLPASASNGRAGRLFKPKHLSTFQPAPSVSFNVKNPPDSVCLCMRECKYPWILEGGAGSPYVGVRNQA